MRKHNIHTHTNYSDGRLSPELLIDTAKQKGLEIIGISDHAFSAKLPDDYQITFRLEQYLNHLRKIQQSADNIDVKIGIEIDISKHFGTDPSQIPFKILNGFDYVIFEYVNTENEYWGKVGNRDISEIIQIRNRLTIPVGLAHNDMQQNYQGQEEQIATLLADNDIFVELNQSEFHPNRGEGRNTRNSLDYYRHFSQRLLQELAKNHVKVVAGTDSHTGESLSNLDDVYQFIENNHLLYHKIVS